VDLVEYASKTLLTFCLAALIEGSSAKRAFWFSFSKRDVLVIFGALKEWFTQIFVKKLMVYLNLLIYKLPLQVIILFFKNLLLSS